MEKIKYYIEKYKLLIFIVLSLISLIISLIYVSLKGNNEKDKDIEILEIKEDVTQNNKEEEVVVEKVKVDIKGLVKKPGVYELDNTSRVIDVINAAGGLKENANTEYINLSKKIVDQMVIIIYSNSDLDKFKKTDKEIIYIEYECICPDNINDACINEGDTVNTNGNKKLNTTDKGSIKEEKSDKEINSNIVDETDNKISINTATIDELMTLNGIGESKAKAIIEYRETNGEFKKLEDIMNVSGIGEAAYSKIKDNIKL